MNTPNGEENRMKEPKLQLNRKEIKYLQVNLHHDYYEVEITRAVIDEDKRMIDYYKEQNKINNNLIKRINRYFGDE
tara:strand:+ start:468 stop:695 length:228 start_codon:yes stop_codon:yes gene_type:complete